MIEQEQSSAQSGKLAYQNTSVGESAETVARHINDIKKQLLREFWPYDQKGKNRRYIEGIILSIFRPDALVLAVVSCLVG